MSLRLNTGVMQYRESQNDVWKPMVIKTNLDWESLAEDYDATSDYEVGTYVLYNAELYRCTTAVPTGGEAWNAAHWIKVDFGSELNSLTEDVNELQEIAGNGSLSGFTATDLTGAANELKNTLTQLDGRVDSTQSTEAYVLGASTAGVSISGAGKYVIYNDVLYTTTASIASTDTAPYTGKIIAVSATDGGGLNLLNSKIITRAIAKETSGSFAANPGSIISVVRSAYGVKVVYLIDNTGNISELAGDGGSNLNLTYSNGVLSITNNLAATVQVTVIKP